MVCIVFIHILDGIIHKQRGVDIDIIACLYYVDIISGGIHKTCIAGNNIGIKIKNKKYSINLFADDIFLLYNNKEYIYI